MSEKQSIMDTIVIMEATFREVEVELSNIIDNKNKQDRVNAILELMAVLAAEMIEMKGALTPGCSLRTK